MPIEPFPTLLVEAIHAALPRCKSCKVPSVPCPVSARRFPIGLLPLGPRSHAMKIVRGRWFLHVFHHLPQPENITLESVLFTGCYCGLNSTAIPIHTDAYRYIPIPQNAYHELFGGGDAGALSWQQLTFIHNEIIMSYHSHSHIIIIYHYIIVKGPAFQSVIELKNWR